ncbi:hypothetical protein ACFE04_002258 [Oxalis oulophora]
MEGNNNIAMELKRTFKSGITRSVTWRKNQLKALLRFIHENEDALFEALYQDLGKHPVEAYRDEIGVVMKSAENALKCVDKWMAPKKSRIPLLLFPASGQVISEPLGVVLIFSSWNFPISLSLDPVIGAISAGNTVVLKPSEVSPACSSFLAKTLPLYLDPAVIKVVLGGPDVCEELLQQKWDKIFFTGTPRIGSLVMSAAAKNLTPVTLELGGKSPAIVDTLSNPAHVKAAAKRILGGKFGSCSGQACIGVDYLLVEEKFAPQLIEVLKTYIRKFYGENPMDSKSICRIVNKNHFNRLNNLLKDPRVSESIIHGGGMDEKKLVIEPTILMNPPLESEIMTEEIFGPFLPIITLNNIQESIEVINSKSKPLIIYAFTNNEKFKEQILSETSSGGVTFNDTLVQFICDTLPFGGVGQSGYGRYHGKFSFDTFSHEKAVLRGSFFPEIEPRYPPWNSAKLRFLKMAFRFDYFGILLFLLGIKR